MKALVLCGAIALALVAGCSDQQAVAPVATAQAVVPAVTPLVNVPAIAEQPPEVVAQLLGEPVGKCEPNKYGFACLYKNETEVVFIDGLADWITVKGDMPYSADALPLMGFKRTGSSFSNEHTMRWSGEQKTLLIQLAPGGKGKTFFAYVKVRTP